jgi:hypothetical protein
MALGLQLATHGRLFESALRYLINAFGIAVEPMCYGFATFWPLAALAERIVSRKAHVKPYYDRLSESRFRPSYRRAMSMFFKNTVNGVPQMAAADLTAELRAGRTPRAAVEAIVAAVEGGSGLVEGQLPFLEFLLILPVIFGSRIKAHK